MRLSTFLILILCSASSAVFMPNLPLHAKKLNGYALNAVTRPTAQMDIFFGPFCEDSKRLFPTIKRLAAAVDSLSVRVHLFPLPYNMGSFLAAQSCVAAGIVSNETDMVPACLALLYEGSNQKRIKTNALTNSTVPQTTAELVDLVSSHLHVDRTALSQQMQQGLESGASSYDATKSDWKYGTSKGVFATPAVFINHVQVFGYDAQGAKQGSDHAEGQLASMTLADWEAFIAPVLESS